MRFQSRISRVSIQFTISRAIIQSTILCARFKFTFLHRKNNLMSKYSTKSRCRTSFSFILEQLKKHRLQTQHLRKKATKNQTRNRIRKSIQRSCYKKTKTKSILSNVSFFYFFQVCLCKVTSIRDIRRDLSEHVNAWIDNKRWLNWWLARWLIKCSSSVNHVTF